MTKPYTDQLAQWVKEKKATPRNKNLVAFLAVRADVKEALDAGYAVKTVWENLHALKRIDFGYDSFLNHVNRQLRRPKASSAAAESNEEIIQAPTPVKPEVKPLSGFHFNPVPNAEELF